MCSSCSCKAALFLEWSKSTRFPSCECVRGNFCCGSGLCGCRSYTTCVYTQASCTKWLFVVLLMKEKKGNHIKYISERPNLQRGWRQKFLSEVHTWWPRSWILLRMGRPQKMNSNKKHVPKLSLSARTVFVSTVSPSSSPNSWLLPGFWPHLGIPLPSFKENVAFSSLKNEPFLNWCITSWCCPVAVLSASSACPLLKPRV